MNTVEIYTRPWCGYCVQAKRLLESKGMEYREYDIQADPGRHAEMRERAPEARTVPQIFIGGRAIGGYTDLAALARSGRLDELMGQPA